MGLFDQGGNTVYPTDEQQRQQFEKEMNERNAMRHAITGSNDTLQQIPNNFQSMGIEPPKKIILNPPPPPYIEGAKPILAEHPQRASDNESSLPLPPILG
jgi:hypothetical protein